MNSAPPHVITVGPSGKTVDQPQVGQFNASAINPENATGMSTTDDDPMSMQSEIRRDYQKRLFQMNETDRGIDIDLGELLLSSNFKSPAQ